MLTNKKRVENARQDVMAVAAMLQNTPQAFVRAFARDRIERAEFMQLASDLFSLASTIIEKRFEEDGK